MSSNYAFIPTTLTEEEQIQTEVGLPIFRELAFDFDTLQLKTRGGLYYYVEKNEAIKIWIYFALLIPRFTYVAYTTDYGQEIYTLIGRYLSGELLKSELKRFIEEALLCNPYITSLSDFDIQRQGAKVLCYFNVNTVYGNVAQYYEYLETA